MWRHRGLSPRARDELRAALPVSAMLTAVMPTQLLRLAGRCCSSRLRLSVCLLLTPASSMLCSSLLYHLAPTSRPSWGNAQ